MSKLVSSQQKRMIEEEKTARVLVLVMLPSAFESWYTL